MDLARRRSIHGWLWCRRLRSTCNRTPAGTGMSRRRERAFKDYIAERGKASLIWDDIRTSFRKIITFFGRLRLDSSRNRALLCRPRKVHHLHFLFLTRRKFTSIPKPLILILLPLEYGQPTLLSNICHHGRGGR